MTPTDPTPEADVEEQTHPLPAPSTNALGRLAKWHDRHDGILPAEAWYDLLEVAMHMENEAKSTAGLAALEAECANRGKYIEEYANPQIRDLEAKLEAAERERDEAIADRHKWMMAHGHMTRVANHAEEERDAAQGRLCRLGAPATCVHYQPIGLASDEGGSDGN